MKGLLFRWIVSGLSLLLVGYIVPGFTVQSFGYALLAAAFLGILNAVVRPVLILLTLPLTVLSLGLFIFVVNGLMLWLLSGIIKGINIESFGSAILGALILSIISFLISSFTYRGGRIQRVDYYELRRGPDGRWS